MLFALICIKPLALGRPYTHSHVKVTSRPAPGYGRPLGAPNQLPVEHEAWGAGNTSRVGDVSFSQSDVWRSIVRVKSILYQWVSRRLLLGIPDASSWIQKSGEAGVDMALEGRGAPLFS